MTTFELARAGRRHFQPTEKITAPSKKLQQLFVWVASHGHLTTFKTDHIHVTIPVLVPDGTTYDEHFEVRTIKEAREVLGY